MKMLKTLAFAALSPVLIKAASDGYDWACEYFGCEDEPKKKRKTPDNTPISVTRQKVIRREYEYYLLHKYTLTMTPVKNLDELTAYLNKKYKYNKSRSTYSKIWKQL